MSKNKDTFKCEINAAPTTISFETSAYFSKTTGRQCRSAIDNYIKNNSEINKLLVHVSTNNQIGNLILLGYVSAVESYFREIFRKVIIIDPTAKKNCEKHSVSYGAAISHDENLLPEALLENTSFASDTNIIENLKQYLGVKGDLPSQVKKVLEDFAKICQIRHCAVHRFSRLGSSNAIKLGLKEHKAYIEKPLKLTQFYLDEIAAVCMNTVKVVNNFLFEYLVERTCNNKTFWEWDYIKDKDKIKKYFDIFHSKTNSTVLKTAYNKLKKIYG